MSKIDEAAVINYITSLNPFDYAQMMKTIHENYHPRTPALTNNITNYWKKQDKSRLTLPSSSAPYGNLGASLSGSSGPPRKLEPSLPREVDQRESIEKYRLYQKSAWKSGFIFRGDKIPSNGKLVLDVEMISLKKKEWTSKKHEQVAATVAVINEASKLVFWAFIDINPDLVCQYFPFITGLDRSKLKIGLPIEQVRYFLKKCFETNIVIGASIAKDLDSLGVQHTNVIDIQTFFHDHKDNPQPFSLKLLSNNLIISRKHHQQSVHSDDARVTLQLYNYTENARSCAKLMAEWMQKLPTLVEKRMELKKCKTYNFGVGDICKCHEKFV